MLSSCIRIKEASFAFGNIVTLCFGYYFALKPLGKLDSGNVHRPPKHIRPPDDRGDAETRPQHESRIVPITLYSRYAVRPLLEMIADNMHGWPVHEVKGIRDLAKVLHRCQVEEALPSRRMIHRNDENDGANGLPVSIFFFSPPSGYEGREPYPPGCDFTSAIRLAHQVQTENAK